ncbi:MAG: hypothetical protein HY658_15025 [Actinobacteria bacterium]|nr:hypothetical protein [Actinomycetota bacterium]
METAAAVLVPAIMAVVVGYLVGTMVRSIRNEKRSAGLVKTWKYFGLSIALCALFFVSWIGQGISEWRVFVEDQRAHREPVEVVRFIERFGQSTFENWQSEFLQLFSFVVLAAILIHRGSAESRDSDDAMQEALARIEKRLDEMTGKR